MLNISVPSFSYGGEVALKDIHLELKSGGVYGLTGRNGAGKTTLLKLISGVLKGAAECTADGKKIPGKDIAFLETEVYLYPKLTVGEFLGVFPARPGFYNEEKMLALFRLNPNQLTDELSSGMKKKLLLLSQIKQDKKLYLLDEPFNGLDPESNSMLGHVIRNLSREGNTFLISSHILLPLSDICERVFHLSDGSVSRAFEPGEFAQIGNSLFGSLEADVKAAFE
jgi:ABC-2 type transport system ATP-binding protein